jgi:hypothetical protein
MLQHGIIPGPNILLALVDVDFGALFDLLADWPAYPEVRDPEILRVSDQ